MHKLMIPILIVTGTHDEIGKACETEMNRVLPYSIVKVFPNSSHVPFYEEPNEYFPVLENFWSLR